MTAWRDDSSSSGKGRGHNGMAGLGEHSGSAQGGKLKLDWGNLVFKRPKLFLRLVLYIDLALSTGGPPQDEDFPPELQRSAA